MGLDLPEDLIKKAETELGETTEVREATIKELRSRVLALPAEAQPHRTDDEYLLAFLRPQKFRVDTALQKLKAYTDFKLRLRPKLEAATGEDFREIMEMGFMRLLVKRDQEGRSVLCLFPAKFSWPDKLKDPDIFLTWTIFWLEQTGAMFDPYVQVNGLVIVEDLQGFSMKQVTAVWFGPLRKVSHSNMQFWRNACPFRLRGILLLNEPSFVDVILAMIKLVTPTKIWERMHLLGRGQEGIQQLHKLVAPDCLPPELGGSLEEKPDAWFQNALAREKEGKLEKAL